MNHSNCPTRRRQFLLRSLLTAGPLALAMNLSSRSAAEPDKPNLQPDRFDLDPKRPHHPPRAQAMISMFMQGGPSQIDLLDPKPLLNKLHMQKFPGKIKYDNAAQASSKVFGSP